MANERTSVDHVTKCEKMKGHDWLCENSICTTGSAIFTCYFHMLISHLPQAQVDRKHTLSIITQIKVMYLITMTILQILVYLDLWNNVGGLFFLSFCWSTRDHIGRSTRDSNPVMKSSAGGPKGYSGHRFRAPRAVTAELLTLHQHRSNNQYRMDNKF